MAASKTHLGFFFFLIFFWIITAIQPVDRHDWFIENILFFVTFSVLVITYERFRFSSFSYFLITIFLSLHLIGAHYTYSEVPLGHWVSEVFNLKRNHYDRAIHFSFGLLMFYPILEFLVRRAHLKGFLSYGLPAACIMFYSGLFEVIEWIVAMVVSPELGAAYLGTQGDEWDAQQDMLDAILGAALAMLVTWIIQAKSNSAANMKRA